MNTANTNQFPGRKQIQILVAALLGLCTTVAAQHVDGEKSFTFEQVRGHELAKGGISLEIQAKAGRILGDEDVTISRPAAALTDPTHFGASGELNVDVWIFHQRASVLSVEALAESRDAYREQGTEQIPVYKTRYVTLSRLVWHGIFPSIQYYQVPAGIYLAGYRDQPYDRVVEAHRGANLEVAIYGQTIVDKSWAPRTFSHKFEFGPLNVTKKPLSKTFAIGPVPVTVSANAGLQAEIELQAQVDVLGPRAAASLPASAWVNGWASAGIGGSILGIGVEAGVRADLKLMQTTITPKLTASLAGLRGDLSLVLNPLSGSMSLYATLRYLIDSVTWKLPLFEFSLPKLSWERQVF